MEPSYLTEREKIEYLAQMKAQDIFPSAFRDDNEITLLRLLARRVIELERKVDNQRPDPRTGFIGG